MALTAAQIRDRAAKKLGLLGKGGTLDHDDKVDVEQAYAEVYAQLKKEGLAVWAFTGGSIPNEIADEVANMIAAKMVDDKGVSNDRAVRILNKAATGIRDIRKFIKPDYITQTAAKDY